MKRVIAGALALCAALLAGCVSFHTNNGENADAESSKMPGLYYYLPKKDLIVTLTVEQKGNSEPVYRFDFDTSAAYPNLSQSYRLNQTKQFFANVEDKYEISKSGLLNSVDVKSESKVETVLDNLTGKPTKGFVEKPVKCAVGTHVLVIDPASNAEKSPDNDGYRSAGELCQFKIMYRVLKSGKTYHEPPSLDVPLAGIVYRNDQPYAIEIRSGTVLKARKILFSPTGALARRLPLKKGFFAQTDHKFVMEDGRLTHVDYTKDSELATVLTAPAKLIGAYTGALGQILSGIHGPSNERLEADKIEANQQLLKAKIEQCRDALDEGVEVAVAQTLCAF
ncbi:hypothetical protein [Endozoicomonas sp. G2_2]|uniref:hypothetical protein n=1 Tax=Endozoicomonas sp. G2_2 TaxID=2821092 RepID=UPI001ADBEE33|nr:hypothetical protein [Endozoicomonas sp. G2_2]